MNRFLLPVSLLAGALLAGCSPATSDLFNPRTASATLLSPTGAATGTATFNATCNGVQVKVNVSGLAPGMHGMHIHENANCNNTTDASGNPVVFGGAGGHYDPGASHKHNTPDVTNAQGHGGDLPMISVGADGTGSASFFSSRISLSGDNSVLGRSIIIHAAPDDYKTDPAGNSGARERCGIIAAPTKGG